MLKLIALSNLQKFDEWELLRRLAEGDSEALTTIYHQFWQPLFLSAYNIIKEKKTCEDIIQDIFLQLWVKRETLQVRSSLKAYLIAATRYQVFRHIRNSPERNDLFDKLQERLTSDPSDYPLLHKDLKKQVDNIVADLPEKCRMIYKLSREEYLSHKEIAERLDISPKTVENQLTIALRKLRLSLKEVAGIAFCGTYLVTVTSVFLFPFMQSFA